MVAHSARTKQRWQKEDDLPAPAGMFETMLREGPLQEETAPHGGLEEVCPGQEEGLVGADGEGAWQDWEEEAELKHYGKYYETHYLESEDGSSFQKTEELVGYASGSVFMLFFSFRGFKTLWRTNLCRTGLLTPKMTMGGLTATWRTGPMCSGAATKTLRRWVVTSICFFQT